MDMGFEQGMEKGMEKGIQEGLDKGAMAKAIEIAKSLIGGGVSDGCMEISKEFVFMANDE